MQQKALKLPKARVRPTQRCSELLWLLRHWLAADVEAGACRLPLRSESSTRSLTSSCGRRQEDEAQLVGEVDPFASTSPRFVGPLGGSLTPLASIPWMGTGAMGTFLGAWQGFDGPRCPPLDLPFRASCFASSRGGGNGRCMKSTCLNQSGENGRGGSGNRGHLSHGPLASRAEGQAGAAQIERATHVAVSGW